MRVLVVEDNRETAEYICSGLRELGYAVKHASDGKQGFLDALDNDYDVMVVDRMLPELYGLSLVKSVRSAKVATPILFLSALNDLNDRVDGLEAGADDYLFRLFRIISASYRACATSSDAGRRDPPEGGRLGN